jgi:manganese transport protein
MLLFNLFQTSAASISGSTQQTELAARDVLTGRRKGIRAFLPFVGPAVIASVGYMDPGNFATNIQAGSSCGYELLWVVVVANVVAMLFQAMSAKLGIVTGRNLAELCREQFSKPVVLTMWLGSEIAAMATDIAEFLGGALGISLLFHVSLLCGLIATGVVTMAILLLDRGGFRPLELVIATLVAVIGLSYVCELYIAPPDWHATLMGSIVPHLKGSNAITLAVGIIGATIMPHTLYLHSGLTQNLLWFSNREVLVALGIAGFVNLAMVMMAAAVFPRSPDGIADIGLAYHSLIPLLGVGAGAVFLISLMASGMSSSVVGTMAGQVIMQGFVDIKIPVWTRRLITMAPAFVVGLHFNVVNAMVISQVALSFFLPIPLVALVVLSSRRNVMGKFAAGKATIVVAALATILIVVLNVDLIKQMIF